MAGGFGDLQRTLDQASRALQELDGEITTVNFNPRDQISVENAIAEIHLAIDNKISPYRGNAFVESMASALKEKYEQLILEKAQVANSEETETPMSDENNYPDLFRRIENTVSDLRRADYQTFSRHIKKLARLLHSDKLNMLTEELKNKVDLEAFIVAGEASQGGMIGSAILEWPEATEEELGIVIALIDQFAAEEDKALSFAHTFYYNGNRTDANLQNMASQVIVPFARDYIDYVKSKTGSKEATLLPVPTQQSESGVRKVFIVHGHDEAARESVARFLEKLGFEAIILHEQANQGRTIIEKIEAHSDVGFAVVLLTPDDTGGVLNGTQQPRARQNVILELGYFVGRLGRARVLALKRGDLEVPSDFGGVVYEPLDNAGAWKTKLGRELVEAGFEIDWNLIMNR